MCVEYETYIYDFKSVCIYEGHPESKCVYCKCVNEDVSPDLDVWGALASQSVSEISEGYSALELFIYRPGM